MPNMKSELAEIERKILEIHALHKNNPIAREYLKEINESYTLTKPSGLPLRDILLQSKLPTHILRLFKQTGSESGIQLIEMLYLFIVNDLYTMEDISCLISIILENSWDSSSKLKILQMGFYIVRKELSVEISFMLLSVILESFVIEEESIDLIARPIVCQIVERLLVSDKADGGSDKVDGECDADSSRYGDNVVDSRDDNHNNTINHSTSDNNTINHSTSNNNTINHSTSDNNTNNNNNSSNVKRLTTFISDNIIHKKQPFFSYILPVILKSDSIFSIPEFQNFLRTDFTKIALTVIKIGNNDDKTAIYESILKIERKGFNFMQRLYAEIPEEVFKCETFIRFVSCMAKIKSGCNDDCCDDHCDGCSCCNDCRRDGCSFCNDNRRDDCSCCNDSRRRDDRSNDCRSNDCNDSRKDASVKDNNHLTRNNNTLNNLIKLLIKHIKLIGINQRTARFLNEIVQCIKLDQDNLIHEIFQSMKCIKVFHADLYKNCLIYSSKNEINFKEGLKIGYEMHERSINDIVFDMKEHMKESWGIFFEYNKKEGRIEIEERILERMGEFTGETLKEFITAMDYFSGDRCDDNCNDNCDGSNSVNSGSVNNNNNTITNNNNNNTITNNNNNNTITNDNNNTLIMKVFKNTRHLFSHESSIPLFSQLINQMRYSVDQEILLSIILEYYTLICNSNNSVIDSNNSNNNNNNNNTSNNNNSNNNTSNKKANPIPLKLTIKLLNSIPHKNDKIISKFLENLILSINLEKCWNEIFQIIEMIGNGFEIVSLIVKKAISFRNVKCLLEYFKKAVDDKSFECDGDSRRVCDGDNRLVCDCNSNRRVCDGDNNNTHNTDPFKLEIFLQYFNFIFHNRKSNSSLWKSLIQFMAECIFKGNYTLFFIDKIFYAMKNDFREFKKKTERFYEGVLFMQIIPYINTSINNSGEIDWDVLKRIFSELASFLSLFVNDINFNFIKNLIEFLSSTICVIDKSCVIGGSTVIGGISNIQHESECCILAFESLRIINGRYNQCDRHSQRDRHSQCDDVGSVGTSQCDNNNDNNTSNNSNTSNNNSNNNNNNTLKNKLIHAYTKILTNYNHKTNLSKKTIFQILNHLSCFMHSHKQITHLSQSLRKYIEIEEYRNNSIDCIVDVCCRSNQLMLCIKILSTWLSKESMLSSLCIIEKIKEIFIDKNTGINESVLVYLFNRLEQFQDSKEFLFPILSLIQEYVGTGNSINKAIMEELMRFTDRFVEGQIKVGYCEYKEERIKEYMGFLCNVINNQCDNHQCDDDKCDGIRCDDGQCDGIRCDDGQDDSQCDDDKCDGQDDSQCDDNDRYHNITADNIPVNHTTSNNVGLTLFMELLAKIISINVLYTNLKLECIKFLFIITHKFERINFLELQIRNSIKNILEKFLIQGNGVSKYSICEISFTLRLLSEIGSLELIHLLRNDLIDLLVMDNRTIIELIRRIMKKLHSRC